ncbi:hypothetical protein [Desulfonatronum sp. SC1]|uniref:type II toxin-antitoxin system BrnA family antitoxin n=1 Tax=Desulfonatronum sp. SC1 TaxID=2109626 RepID=UPI0018EE72C4|nr:hypothetical protein [Desulfonatronum sp. SC1]
MRRAAQPRPVGQKLEEFDAKFDAGEDISEYQEVSKGFRPGWEQKKVNVDIPVWMIDPLDTQARRIRQDFNRIAPNPAFSAIISAC